MTVAVMSARVRLIIQGPKALANWYVLAGLDPHRLSQVEELSDKTLIFQQD